MRSYRLVLPARSIFRETASRRRREMPLNDPVSETSRNVSPTHSGKHRSALPAKCIALRDSRGRSPRTKTSSGLEGLAQDWRGERACLQVKFPLLFVNRSSANHHDRQRSCSNTSIVITYAYFDMRHSDRENVGASLSRKREKRERERERDESCNDLCYSIVHSLKVKTRHEKPHDT